MKRASSDDVVEVPNPNLQQPPRSTPQQTQGTSQSPQAPRFSNLTSQQIAALDPEARKRYEQARLAQANQPNPADVNKLRVIMQEEIKRARDSLPDITMDAQTKLTVTNMLLEILTPLHNMGKAFQRWYQITHDDSRARIFFRTVSNNSCGTFFKLPR